MHACPHMATAGWQILTELVWLVVCKHCEDQHGAPLVEIRVRRRRQR